MFEKNLTLVFPDRGRCTHGLVSVAAGFGTVYLLLPESYAGSPEASRGFGQAAPVRAEQCPSQPLGTRPARPTYRDIRMLGTGKRDVSRRAACSILSFSLRIVTIHSMTRFCGHAWQWFRPSATPGSHFKTSIWQTPSTGRGCGSAGSSSSLCAPSGIVMEWRSSTTWPSSAFFTTSSYRPLWGRCSARRARELKSECSTSCQNPGPWYSP